MASNSAVPDKDRRDPEQPEAGNLAPAGNGAQDEVDEASEESFPASDPPSFTPASASGRHEKQR